MNQKGRMPRLLRRVLAWHPYFWIGLLQGRYGDIVGRVGTRLRKRSGG
jgi:hypothetical protein